MVHVIRRHTTPLPTAVYWRLPIPSHYLYLYQTSRSVARIRELPLQMAEVDQVVKRRNDAEHHVNHETELPICTWSEKRVQRKIR